MYVERWLCAWLWVVWLAVGTLLSACLMMQIPRWKQAHRAYTCEPRRAEESDYPVSVGGCWVQGWCALKGGDVQRGRGEECNGMGWGGGAMS